MCCCKTVSLRNEAIMYFAFVTENMSFDCNVVVCCESLLSLHHTVACDPDHLWLVDGVLPWTFQVMSAFLEMRRLILLQKMAFLSVTALKSSASELLPRTTKLISEKWQKSWNNCTRNKLRSDLYHIVMLWSSTDFELATPGWLIVICYRALISRSVQPTDGQAHSDWMPCID